MNPWKPHHLQNDPPKDPELQRWFQALGPPPVGHPPPDLRAKVRARIEEQRARRGVFAWLRQGWSPTWATALATGLLLSVGMNTWLGYEVLQQRQPSETPSRPSGDTRREHPPATGQLIFRGDEPQGYTRELEQGHAEAVLVEELRRLTVAHYQAKHYAQAITAASAALVLDANASGLYFYRGMAYEAIGNRRQAIQDLQHAAHLANGEAQRVLRTWGVEW
jgi:tetratricopeptide (TPR) repeat protein